MTSRRRSGGIWALGIAAGIGAGVAVERLAMRRVQRRFDTEREHDFATLPGAPVPVRSRDGTALHCRVVGPDEGPTLVFAHGILLDLTTWYYQWRHFSPRYRCVLYDQRGHGRSEKASGRDYSIEALGADLRAVLDATCGEGPVILIGHSMGGMGIASLADRHPEEFGGRVVGAVLVDTTVSDVVREALGAAAARVERVVRPLARRLTSDVRRLDRIRRRIQSGGSDLAYVVTRLTNFGPDASAAQVAHVSRVAMASAPEVWSHTLASVIDLDLRHAIERISVPTLVVVGDADRITPKTSAEALLRALPRGRGIVLTGAGHISMMERHASLNRAAGQFLEDVLGAREAAEAAVR